MTTKNNSSYEAPRVETVNIQVEKGFATSAPGFEEYEEDGIFD